MDNEITDNIVKLLKSINNPLTNRPFDIDKDIKVIEKNGNVNLTIEINSSEVDIYKEVKSKITEDISKIKNVLSVNVILTSNTNNESNYIKKPDKTKYNINSKNIIAIASGKGGVGKSTVAVSLAIALKNIGKSVSILDADIYGPSIPKMMGITKKPSTNENNKIIPLENYGIQCMSIGFLIDAETPTIWRGPMIMKALEQLFISVEWDATDFMIVDLPPGTGDTQITISQKVPLKGAIIVSTPQDIALIDARKGINMFKKVNVPVLGIIENMSYFICDKCNARHEIFSHGGAKNEATKLGTNFLGEIMLDKNLRAGMDQGKPEGIFNQEGEIAKKYLEIAKKLSQN